MKSVVCVLFAALLLASCGSAVGFEQFKAKHGKTYATEAEERYRKGVFANNMRVAALLQAAEPLAQFGMSPFADLTADEFKIMHNLNYTKVLASRNPQPLEASIPSAAGKKMDWREHNAVTEVKNQGLKCGSCWSFGTTGNIEGQWAIAGNKLTSLSEQELVSCDTTDGGCRGGLPDDAFEWLLSSRDGKIVTEASYPYVSGNGDVPACSAHKGTFGAQITGHKDLPSDEDQMASWLYTNGPIAIGVDGSSFQTYVGGILSNCEFSHLDHAVLIVGFDDTFSTPYWIIKNSWGPTWGEEGYIRVAKGSNQCGLSNAPATSIVASGPAPPTPSPTPAPPVPQTPVPAPTPAPTSGGSYSVSLCYDPFCGLCQTVQPQANQCVDGPFHGNSFRAECINGGAQVRVTSYSSKGCSNESGSRDVDTNTCSADGQYYIDFKC